MIRLPKLFKRKTQSDDLDRDSLVSRRTARKSIPRHMQRVSEAQKELIQNAIRQGRADQLSDIVSIVHETGAMTATREAAMAEARRALKALEHLHDSTYKSALAQLAEGLLSRKT